MSKLTDEMAKHPEMTAIDITRIRLREVPEPVTRAGLEALLDLIEVMANGLPDAAKEAVSLHLDEMLRTGGAELDPLEKGEPVDRDGDTKPEGIERRRIDNPDTASAIAAGR